VKNFFSKTWVILPGLAALAILFNFAISGVKWGYAKLTEKDVLVSVIHGHVIDDFIKEIRNNYRKEILDSITDEKKIKSFFQANKKKLKPYLKKDLDIGFIKESINFGLKQFEDPWMSLNSLEFIEIRNLKEERIRKVSIRVPGIYNYSHVKIITDSIPSDKVTEIEKKCSLNKDTNILFLNGIEELPPNSLFRIFIFGFGFLPAFDEVTVSFEGGAGKVRVATSRYSDFEGFFRKTRAFQFPSLQIILISIILVMIFYLVIINLGKMSDQNQ
jgi:hypothetical protein